MREARGSRLIGRGLRRVSAEARGDCGRPGGWATRSEFVFGFDLARADELDLVPGNPVRGFAAESLHLEAFGHAGGFVDRSGGVQVGVFLGHPGLGRDSEVVEAIEKGAALLFGERMRPEAGRFGDPEHRLGWVQARHLAEEVADRRGVVNFLEHHQAISRLALHLRHFRGSPWIRPGSGFHANSGRGRHFRGPFTSARRLLRLC